MAVIVLDNQKTATKQQIFHFIISHFTQLKERAIQLLTGELFGSGVNGGLQDEDVLDGFNSAFERYEVPVRRAPLCMQEDDGVRNHTWLCDLSWAVDPAAARIFLRPHLYGEACGPFPFLDLPGELRTTIYDYVLSYPDLRLQGGRQAMAWLGYPLGLGNANELLAITQVNKQLYHEALPVFYGANMLRLTYPASTTSFFRQMQLSDPTLASNRRVLCANEPIRSNCIKRLHLVCSHHDTFHGTSYRKMFEHMITWNSLEYLVVEISCYGWDLRLDLRSEEEMPHIRPMLRLMHKVKKSELIVRCKDSEKYLLSELEKLKAQVKSGS